MVSRGLVTPLLALSALAVVTTPLPRAASLERAGVMAAAPSPRERSPSGAGAQTAVPQTPAPGASSAGTGTIAGVVLSAATGRPVRGTTVFLSGPVTSRTITDSQGRFSFIALPGGRFMVDASRDGFFPVSYGASKPGKPGTPIDLADSQRVDVEVRMGRGSVITGLVLDESGEPLIGARVRALQYLINQNGVRRLRVVSFASTDDRGIYRFFTLPPGEYVVSATPVPQGSTTGAFIEMNTPDLPPGVAGIDGDVGGFAISFSLPEGAADAYSDQFAPTYHPMSSTAAGAVKVALDGTNARAGVDIQVLPVGTGIIRGTVTGMPGPTTAVQVLLHNTDAAEEPTSITGNVDADGAFALGPVPPGQYTVYAQTLPMSENGPVSNVNRVRAASFDRLHGRASLTVEGPDPPAIVIPLRPGRSITGRVVFDLSQTARTGGERPPTRISITPAPQPAGWPAFNTSPQVDAGADGTFTLPGIRPGRYFLRASGPGMVRSVMWNGLDTLDFPLEVTADQDIAGIVITLTDRQSQLSGTITNAAGQPKRDATVIAFSTDSRFWIPGSRRVAVSQPGADDRYNFSGLPAGEYRLALAEDFDAGTRFDRDVLQQLTVGSVTVTIAEAGRHVQNLRFAR